MKIFPFEIISATPIRSIITNVNGTYSNSSVLFKMDTDRIVLQTIELLMFIDEVLASN